jgi:hypothetical protein
MGRRWALAVICTAVGLLVSTAVSVAQDQDNDPRSTIEGTISALLEKLRAQKYADVIRDFEAPDDLRRLEEQAPLEKLVASGIAKGDFDRLLASCEYVRKLKPQLSKTGTLAVFQYVDASGKNVTFGLKRVGNRWYLP